MRTLVIALRGERGLKSSISMKIADLHRLRDTFLLKCGENDFECHDTFDSESEMTSN